MPRSVVLLGKGTLLIRIAEWFQANPDYEIVHVVPVVPEPTWTDLLIPWCDAHYVPYVPTGHHQDIPGVQSESWRVDLALSVFYSWILPSWFIERTGRCLNLHNGPLPKYRGIAPINWALKNGERRHGVTIHEITPDIDAGPIVSQVTFDIYPEVDEVIDVYNRALEYGYCLFEQTLPMLDRIEPTPQDESEATHYKRQDQERLGERRDFTRAISVMANLCQQH
jgi:hypothetical protein